MRQSQFSSAPESTWHAQLSVSGNYSATKTTSLSSRSPEYRHPKPGTVTDGKRAGWALEVSDVTAGFAVLSHAFLSRVGWLSKHTICVDDQMLTEACEACVFYLYSSGRIKLLEHCSLGISVWRPRTPGNPGSARSSLFQLYFCVRLDFPHIF